VCPVVGPPIKEGHGETGGPLRRWGVEWLPCEEMQGQPGWFSLEKGCLQGHLTAHTVPVRTL